jgi:hypothetical protein
LAQGAAAQSRSVEFDAGIGVVPLRNAATTELPVNPALNVVHGVNPAGQPWVIGGLRADVKVDGRIAATGRALLLAGGNNIGTKGATTTVGLRLVCGGVAHVAGPVDLDEQGDFRFSGVLAPVPPNPCAGPVLLITNAAGTSWFAAGVLKTQ